MAFGFEDEEIREITGRFQDSKIWELYEPYCGKIESLGCPFIRGDNVFVSIEKTSDSSFCITCLPTIYQGDSREDATIVYTNVQLQDIRPTLDRLLGQIDLMPRRQLPLAETGRR
ncbi:MAG: hypothetical protein V1734_03445 [Nanoarchaeota archaeon]